MVESRDHTGAVLANVSRLAVFVLALGLAIGALGNGVALAADHWTDISDAQWLSQYNVSAEQAATVAEGYPNGDGTWRFEPGVAVKRGQFAKMAVNGLGIDTLDSATPTFKDVPVGSTFYGFIEGAAAAELVQGWTLPSGRYYRPDDSISRQQAITILGRYLSDAEMDASNVIQGQVSAYPNLQAWYEAEGDFSLKGFADWSQVAIDHRPAVAYLHMHGVVAGSDGKVNPKGTLTRAQAVALTLRVEHEVLTIVQPPAPPTGVATVPVSPSSDRAPFVVGQTIVDGRVAVYDTYLNATNEVAQGNADSTGEFSVRVPTLAEGLHIFTVKVRNERNKISGPSADVPYVVDVSPPTGSFTLPADGGGVASMQPRVVVAAADAWAGVMQVLFQYRAGTTGGFLSIGADVSAPFEAPWGDLNLPGEGAYEFRAVVRDNAGNEATVGPIAVVVDTTKPTVTLTAPVATGTFYTTAHTMVFAADAADSAAPGVVASGAQKVDFLYQLKNALIGAPASWMAGDFTRLSTSMGPGYIAVWDDTALPDGDYIFAVQSTDNAGNESLLDWQEVIIDNAPPVIALQAPGPGDEVPDHTPYTIRWTVTDVSPVAAMKIEVSATGDSPWTVLAAAAPTTGTTGEFIWDTANVTGDDVTTYRLRLTAKDAAAAALGEADHATEFTSPAFTLAEAPAPATGLLASDPEASVGPLTGADFHLAWTPSASTDVVSQSIYVLPQTVGFGDSSQSPVTTFGDRTSDEWTGTEALTEDSAGVAFDPHLHYSVYVLSVDASAAQTVSAGAPVPWPAAPTGVTTSDVDASAGVTLADVQVSWVPSTSAGVTQQEIYVLPGTSTLLDLSDGLQTAVQILGGNADILWRGNPADSTDSAGGALAPGAYSVWVVAVDGEGHRVPSERAALVTSAP